MINAELGHCKTLPEFYKSIREQQEGEHGADYCAQHDALIHMFTNGGCKTYRELGTHQGGTAAAVMLQNPEYMDLIDIDMHRYNKFLAPIAREYAKEHDIKLSLKEVSSASLAAIGPLVDVMLIDSVHRWVYTKEELKYHASSVKKYIVFHDTTTCLDIWQGINEYCKTEPFEILDRFLPNVGYTVIKRK